MATSQENVFRFVAVRPPDTIAKCKKKKMALYPGDAEERSAFYVKLEGAQKQSAGKPAMASIAAEFRASESYVDQLSDLAFNVQPLVDWVAANRDQPFDNFKAIIEERYPNLSQAVRSSEFQQSLTALTDTILCDAIKPYRSQHSNDYIVSAFKLMSLLNQFVDDPSLFATNQTVGEMFSAYRIMLPKIARAPTTPPVGEDDAGTKGEQKQQAVDQDVKQEEVNRLREHLRKLEVARKEFSRIAADPSYWTRTGASEAERDSRIQSLERRVGELTLAFERLEQQQRSECGKSTRAQTEPIQHTFAVKERSLFLASSAVEDLKQESKEVIELFELDLQRVSPEHVLQLIEEEMSDASSRLPSDFTPRRVLLMQGMTLDLEEFRESVSGGSAEVGIAAQPSEVVEGGYLWTRPLPLLSQCKFQAGVADLLVVKQELKAYEVANFAHTENVLAGELKDREHRRLNVREEYIELETEEEIEKERDLQSTARNEMQAEAEQVVQSQFDLSAGTQISGSYGGVVSFSANLDVGYSTATEESKSKVQSYAREVTQRTSERIMERVREERRTRVLEEIEETNKDQISNTTERHVRGIYRWLNKIYEAQIMNYGQRMMFEFTIPEPAAYFLYSMVDNPPAEFVLIEPDPPSIAGRPLRPDLISSEPPPTSGYYPYLIGKYHVTNAPVPPPRYLTVSYFDSYDGQGGDGSTAPRSFARAGKIEIPKDYEASEAFVDCLTGYVLVNGSIGNESFQLAGEWPRLVFPPGSRFYGDISFALTVDYARYFALSINIRCELTSSAKKQWQQDMYDAVMDAYNQQRADYESKIAAMALQKGIPILGRNPLENRQIERDELKKLVIMMLMSSPRFEFDSFHSSEHENEEPLVNTLKACENGATIRFFEQAFEWNNMLYVFYPYFWGRRARWSNALHITDPDPDFAAFLKAGAARVQVPVRPGFESAVAHYCQTREIWEGNDAPLIDDDLYVPIVNEITEKVGTFDEGVPYPDPEYPQPWEVTVPTSLVIVQNLEEIPAIRDILTNQPITILDNA